MVDYVGLANTAKRLVDANGRDIVFVKLDTVSADPLKPHRGAVDPRGAGAVNTTVRGVEVGPNELGAFFRSQDLIKRADKFYYVAPGPTFAFDLTTYDEVNDGGERFNVLAIEKLTPAATTVLYAVACKR